MSQENVEIARQMYDAFNRGDVDGCLSAISADVEWHEAATLFDRGVYRGHDGIRRLIAENMELWSNFRAEIEEIFDAGNDVVVALGHFTGEIGGIGVRIRFVHVGEMHQSQLLRLREYEDAGMVRRALGDASEIR
jgi:uncharacterized protein